MAVTSPLFTFARKGNFKENDYQVDGGSLERLHTSGFQPHGDLTSVHTRVQSLSTNIRQPLQQASVNPSLRSRRQEDAWNSDQSV